MAEIERRRARRFPIAVPVEILQLGNRPMPRLALTRDLGTAGAFIHLDLDTATGSLLEFVIELTPDITLSESLRVLCQGTVVRVERKDNLPAGIAIRIDSYNLAATA